MSFYLTGRPFESVTGRHSLGVCMSDGGKGSSQRPTDKKKYDDNYDKIFGKKKKEEKK